MNFDFERLRVDCKVKPVLTYCMQRDSSAVICWIGPFAILGVLGLFCHFYSIFDGKSC